MHIRWIAVGISLASLALASCGKKEAPEEEKPKISRTVLGEVTSVHPEQGFILFRRYGPGQLVEGGLLSSRSLDGRRAASLTQSPEKMGRFYTADYEKGTEPPQVGDLVVLTKDLDDTKNGTFSGEVTGEVTGEGQQDV